MLDDKAYSQGSPTMADRIRARLSRIYSFAIERGLAEENSVSKISTYKEGKTKRSRYYSRKEIRELWNAFDEQAKPMGALLKMLLLTGQRKNETMHMRWDDIQGNIWTIPVHLAKNIHRNNSTITSAKLKPKSKSGFQMTS